MLKRFTPIVLTWNEGPNLARCLAALTWADTVVVLDSGSTDDTEVVARGYPNVRWEVRPFDSHRQQWQHAVNVARSEYVLALDADMVVPPAFVDELRELPTECAGIVSFEYHLLGAPLRGSVYPPQVRVFRPAAVRIEQAGHTQEFLVPGPVHRFRTPWIHDDRKPLERWVANQVSYSALEERRLFDRGGRARLRDRLRRLGVMPAVIGPYAWLRAGGPLAGAAGVRYALERTVFEALLAIRVVNRRLGGEERTR